MLEETAYALGDGAGKLLGIVHSTSGVPVTTASTGSASQFKRGRPGRLGRARGRVEALRDLDDVPSAFPGLAGLTDSAGSVLPSLQNENPPLLGRPVLTDALRILQHSTS